MWARVIEFMLGCWLAMSPFIFGHAPEDTARWVTDLGCGSAIAALALLSYWQPTRHAHLLSLLCAFWLLVFGRFASSPPLPPALQNDIALGLLLLMIAVIPNDASRPPKSWHSPAAADQVR